MFDFSNLSDYEFEVLTKDILERLTNQKLRVFKQGKDGGIDVMNGEVDNILIAQAKRYTTSFSNLKISLAKLIPNLKRINPKSLYIVTSLGLTPQNLDEIFKMFSQYISDKNQILGRDDLSQLLEKEEYKDIVAKNFKLWMSASNVLSSFLEKNTELDSRYFVDNIVEKKNIYVETESYKKCLKILNEQKTLLIVGDPGVGKSTVTNMITLNYFNKGFQVLFSSNKKIESLKRLLSNDEVTKQLFVIDDFLGQVCMDLKSEAISELYTLISAIKAKPNKYLILNSRITILNTASSYHQIPFNSILKKIEQSKIDLNEMSDYERAKILYNHLYFSDISNDYFDQIKIEERYMQIIKHKNFNPRIIEFVTDSENLLRNSITHDKYYSFIMKVLENSEDIWRNEIERNMSKSERILLQTLYSISTTGVELNILERAVNRRLSNSNDIDHTLPNFKNSMNVLNGACIKIILSDKQTFVSVVNPSVNDYLKSAINSEIEKDILKSATTLDQYEKFVPNFLHSEVIKGLIDSNELFELDSTYIMPHYYFLQYLYENKIVDVKYKDKIWKALTLKKDVNSDIFKPKDYFKIIHYLFFGDSYLSYDLNKLANSESIFIILNKFNLCEATNFIEDFTANYFDDIVNFDDFSKKIKKKLIEKIEDETIEEIDDQLDSLIYDMEADEDFEYNEDYIYDQLNQKVYDMANELSERKLPKFYTCPSLNFSINDIIISNIYLNVYTRQAAADFLKSRELEEKYEYLADDFYDIKIDYTASIRDMFNT